MSENQQQSLPLLSVNGLNFESEVVESSSPVLIDISAPWCAPCKVAEPVVKKLAAEWQGRVKVVKVDGEESPDLVARLSVRGFPTFLVYAGGSEQRRSTGFRSATELRQLIED